MDIGLDHLSLSQKIDKKIPLLFTPSHHLKSTHLLMIKLPKQSRLWHKLSAQNIKSTKKILRLENPVSYLEDILEIHMPEVTLGNY